MFKGAEADKLLYATLETFLSLLFFFPSSYDTRKDVSHVNMWLKQWRVKCRVRLSFGGVSSHTSVTPQSRDMQQVGGGDARPAGSVSLCEFKPNGLQTIFLCRSLGGGRFKVIYSDVSSVTLKETSQAAVDLQPGYRHKGRPG